VEAVCFWEKSEEHRKFDYLVRYLTREPAHYVFAPHCPEVAARVIGAIGKFEVRKNYVSTYQGVEVLFPVRRADYTIIGEGRAGGFDRKDVVLALLAHGETNDVKQACRTWVSRNHPAWVGHLRDYGISDNFDYLTVIDALFHHCVTKDTPATREKCAGLRAPAGVGGVHWCWQHVRFECIPLCIVPRVATE
jgi:hypothetical protein